MHLREAFTYYGQLVAEFLRKINHFLEQAVKAEAHGRNEAAEQFLESALRAENGLLGVTFAMNHL